MATLLILNLLLLFHWSALSMLDQEELHSQTPTLDQSTGTSNCSEANASSSTPDQSSCILEQPTSQRSIAPEQSTSARGQPSLEGELEPGSNAFSSSTQSQTDPNSRSNDRPQKYVGNSYSLKFHKPSCPFARVMRKSRRVAFPYRKTAIDAGQRPCKYCLPPWWLKVEAKILNYDRQTESTQEASRQDK